MTPAHLMKAVDKVIRRIDSSQNILASEHFVGFVHGHYVSVKAYQFDQELLKNHPETGGLLVNRPKRGTKNGRI